ncbi:prepilin-type N-terminal cleavage/methylation domain-containing protein [Alteromonas genovensis]|uniref:Prepilin-type N-terminal cleavage/methylation domain-containing protein n=1 Tax=Alteromonas genovensis TaxID=471225 RepID=A0A6N9TK79_9ALTE|nr:prepilin-type N-terminal cleavage/methylation domain-containing protein [Alteromonas genovensis]
MKKLGFTLVELIITILVIGVLAATVAPRFLGNDSEEATALRDRTLHVVRNIQLRAMQNVNDTSCVKITPSTIAPPAGHDCSNAVSTAFDRDQVVNAPSGFSFQTADESNAAFTQIQFDNMGKPSNIACNTPCEIRVKNVAVCLQQEGAIYAC